VEPAHLEGHEALLAEVDRLLERAALEVPEVDAAAVTPRLDVGEVEALLVGVRLAELGRDEDVLARLVPEVVVERRQLAAVLPATIELERVPSRTAKPPAPFPCASPSIEMTTLSPGMQCTVCGRV
jgi:hypothetical protein